MKIYKNFSLILILISLILQNTKAAEVTCSSSLTLNDCVKCEENEDNCTECDTGYRIFTDQVGNISCETEISECEVYSQYDVNDCEICEEGFYFNSVSGTCDTRVVTCSDNFPNCVCWDNETNCVECVSDDYRLYEQNEQYLCLDTIDNCQKYSTQFQYECEQCDDGYKFSQGECQSRVVTCDTEYANCECWDTTQNCQYCQNGFRKYDGNCYLIIDNCFYYSEEFPDQCVVCDPLYNLTIDEDVTDESLLYITYKCEAFEDNCKSYTSDWLCANCNEGYQLFKTSDGYYVCVDEQGYTGSGQILKITLFLSFLGVFVLF